uniref:NR LBD domain-containing protein n=1 Tax=Ditylenchus dipsaci TaxID=166011 RepID=A0A915D1J4_9BILA
MGTYTGTDHEDAKLRKSFHTHLYAVVIDPIRRIKLTVEELVLLKAIIFSNSAIENLNSRDIKLLQTESCRYSKILLHSLQVRLGILPGAKRFGDILSIVSCLLKAAQQTRKSYIILSGVLKLQIYDLAFIDAVVFV